MLTLRQLGQYAFIAGNLMFAPSCQTEAGQTNKPTEVVTTPAEPVQEAVKEVLNEKEQQKKLLYQTINKLCSAHNIKSPVNNFNTLQQKEADFLIAIYNTLITASTDPLYKDLDISITKDNPDTIDDNFVQNIQNTLFKLGIKLTAGSPSQDVQGNLISGFKLVSFESMKPSYTPTLTNAITKIVSNPSTPKVNYYRIITDFTPVINQRGPGMHTSYGGASQIFLDPTYYNNFFNDEFNEYAKVTKNLSTNFAEKFVVGNEFGHAEFEQLHLADKNYTIQLFNQSLTVTKSQLSEAWSNIGSMEAMNQDNPYELGIAIAKLLNPDMQAIGGNYTFTNRGLNNAAIVNNLVTFPNPQTMVKTNLNNAILDGDTQKLQTTKNQFTEWVVQAVKQAKSQN